MKKSYTTLRLFAWISIGMSLISALLIALCYFLAYDDAIGYFSVNSLFPTLSLLLVALFFCGLIGIVLSSRRFLTIPIPMESPFWLRLVSGVLALGFCGVALLDIRSSASLLAVLLGVGAAAHFLIRAAHKPSHPALSLTALCAVLRLALGLAQIYFDGEIAMNAPLKVLVQLGCVAGMLFLVRDTKGILSPAPFGLTAVALGAGALFTGIASLPSLLWTQKDLILLDRHGSILLLLFLLWIFTLARLLSVALSPLPVTEDQAPPEATAEENDCPEAEEELSEEEPTSETPETPKEGETTEETESEASDLT